MTNENEHNIWIQLLCKFPTNQPIPLKTILLVSAIKPVFHKKAFHRKDRQIGILFCFGESFHMGVTNV